MVSFQGSTDFQKVFGGFVLRVSNLTLAGLFKVASDESDTWISQNWFTEIYCIQFDEVNFFLWLIKHFNAYGTRSKNLENANKMKSLNIAFPPLLPHPYLEEGIQLA